MARNEEKHFTRLNRLILQQQREDELKKNPPRPKLVTLNTTEDIKKWIPSIKRDIDFYLTQSQVPCYPESKIKEFETEISRLEKEYKAYVRKLKELDPSCDVVPWTDRAYTNRKRPHTDVDEGTESPIKKVVVPDSQEDSRQVNSDADRKISFERISLPILTSETEENYRREEEESQPVVSTNVNLDTADKPLDFKPIDVHQNMAVKVKRAYVAKRFGLYPQQGASPVGGDSNTDDQINDTEHSVSGTCRTDTCGVKNVDMSGHSAGTADSEPHAGQGQLAIEYMCNNLTKINNDSKNSNILGLDYGSSDEDT